MLKPIEGMVQIRARCFGGFGAVPEQFLIIMW
jgi:hypothetical protein